jgi:cellulose synthase/poly-beta-1,6-N-acetylglucosamine synthase-like glycosyltransferase
MPQLYFGNLLIDKNFLYQISQTFFQKKLLDSQNFENLEDFFRFLYYKLEEKIAKNFLSTIYNIKFFDDISVNLCTENFIIPQGDSSFCQKNLCLFYQETHSSLQIFIDYLSDEILERIEINFQNQYSKIEFILCKKDFLIHKISQLFQKELFNHSVNNLNDWESAKNLNFLKKNNILKITIFIASFLFLSFLSSFFIIFFIIFANLCYCTSIFYKIFLSIHKAENKKINPNVLQNIKKYPIYTILLPIYKENEKTIKQLITSIENLDYPQHKLDVKILIEDNDKISQKIIQSFSALKYNFDIINIPNFLPQTKAKACNFAINFSKGEFLVIYDSDDIPEISQLKIALNNFRIDPRITCLQASLNSYNFNENFFTKFYSIEFDLWYKVFLPQMNYLNFPTTFGGTSNHFRIDILKKNLWDAWNVTEDADLGIRWWLKNLGSVKMIQSQTLEEAPISIKALINQRSRWTKGFLQTYFVHRKNKNIRFNLWLNLFILLPIFSNVLFLPVIFKFLLLKFYHQNEQFLIFSSKISLYLFLINYFLQLTPILLHFKKFLHKLNLSIIFFPLYSLIINIPASYKALYQLIFKPFFWEKTTHGLSKTKNKKL